MCSWRGWSGVVEVRWGETTREKLGDEGVLFSRAVRSDIGVEPGRGGFDGMGTLGGAVSVARQGGFPRDWRVGRAGGARGAKHYDTGDSQIIPESSTNPAQCCLASGI
jgi:hypothetical protein